MLTTAETAFESSRRHASKKPNGVRALALLLGVSCGRACTLLLGVGFGSGMACSITPLGC